MTKSDLIRVLGSQKAIADLLKVTPSAVSQWPERIPELRRFQILEAVPDIERRIGAEAGARGAA